MFNDLDAILHSQLRLAIVSILVGVEEAEFTALREMTKASAGNLSIQLNKLKEHNYISIEKGFKNNYPYTCCKITPTGVLAFERYVENLKKYIEVNKKV